MMDAVPPTQRDAPIAPRLLAALSGGVLLTALVITCSPRQDAVAQVRTTGVLRVATINSPTTYYIGPDGPTGYEYDLVAGFAQQLGVKLEILLAQNQEGVIEKVRSGAAQLGAAGLAIAALRAHDVRYTPPVASVVPELIYRIGSPRPRGLEDLAGKLVVATGSSEALRLRQLQRRYPNLKWEETDQAEAEDLLYQVAHGDIDYTIANSDLVLINQRYYPQLAIGFTLSDSQELAWALAPGPDVSLFNAAQAYLKATSGTERARLRDRHFGQATRIGYFSSVTLAADVGTRLPRYRKHFERAAAAHNFDWRFLAAIGYQESHWDARAISPTGVRGLMMLTEGTARFLNVSNREDAAQSIEGGSRYIRFLVNELPTEIAEPDRTWMALAAYNMGMGHLIDVRELTRRIGGNPNRWLDVRNTLPLLTQSKWHSKTKYGYARGHEAQQYVTNVRTYYDMLVWMTSERETAPAQEEIPPPPQEKKKDPLNIHSPVL